MNEISKKPKRIDVKDISTGYGKDYVNGHNQAIDDYEKFLPSEDELRTIIVKHTSEMLDNPDKYEIYPTTKFYNDLIEAISKRIGRTK